MKILLDDNFPLHLYRRLRLSGHEVEHIIVLGQRGLPDSSIRQRIVEEELVFLTQDTEFEKLAGNYRGIIIISRLRQSLPIQKRTAIWFAAIEKYLSERPAGRLFDLSESGELVAWKTQQAE